MSKRKISVIFRLVIFAALAAMTGGENMSNTEAKHYNRLKDESSPYLLQHADNPVDWYPWGDEAFALAKKLDKPIFLSIGYSTCHWCHVMEHESFENEEIAKIMNEHFVCIKVDREQRPDVDSVYMDAVQAMTGSGGWPLSIFLTPDGMPFYGGTYFPPKDMYGRPGFTKILLAVADSWENKRDELADSAAKLTQALAQQQKTEAGQLSLDVIDRAVDYLKKTYDPVDGGFGSAPKFPQGSNLTFLMWNFYRTNDAEALKMVMATLDKMADGGMYDHLGGGFHRYSTDAKWLVPHFEKMLYDQALLARSYLQAYQITGHVRYANTVKAIFDYVLRDMADSKGGFYSAEDADSEGEEGTFYVWEQKEIVKVLTPDKAKVFNAYYGVSKSGNFEHGTNILNVTKSVADVAKKSGITVARTENILKESRAKLFARRAKRIRPGRDEKIIAGWNGLMISAMAAGGAALGEEKYTKAAIRSADFVMNNLYKDGRLMRHWAKNKANELAVVNDYAFMIMGLVDLYEATYQAKWLVHAKKLSTEMIELFGDETGGGFYLTGKDGRKLIFKKKPAYDGAIPSGNSVAALALLRLGQLTMDTKLIAHGEKTLKAFSGDMARFPGGLVEMLTAVDFYFGPKQEIVIAGAADDETVRKMILLVQEHFMPRTVVLLHESGKSGKDIEKIAAFVENQIAIDGQATAYVCENFVCKKPVTDYDSFKKLIGKNRVW